MNNCIIGQGEKWDNCLNHKNSNGGHGEYMCVYIYQESTVLNAPQFCKLKVFEIEDELFYLEK